LTGHEDWLERKERIRNGELVAVIRERTAMYTGSRTLSALSSFLDGWHFAMETYDIEPKHALPRDFHDWVAYRLHFLESTSGYKNMILKHAPDEYAAVDRFYELLDEYHARQPRVVARLAAYRGRDGVEKFRHDGTREPVKRPDSPYVVSLIAYTDDPGFFVEFDADDPTVSHAPNFYPLLNWFERGFGVSRETLEVLDVETFKRWLDDDDKYKIQSRERLKLKQEPASDEST
jgi:hypothetical protein